MHAYAGESFGRDDFLFSAELESAKAPVRRVLLNAEILQYVQTMQLGDVRVFDASGREMPVLVRKRQAESAVAQHELTQFPLYGTRSNASDLQLTDVERDDEGRVVSIRSRRESEDSDALITAYIIDQSEYKDERLAELELQWNSSVAQPLVNVQIESSDNLTQWQPLVNSAALAHFNMADKAIERNTISLSVHSQRYLRLTPLGDVKTFVLEKVIAHYNTPISSDFLWLNIGAPKTQIEQGETWYTFSMPGGVAPERLKFDFSASSSDNGLISGALYSKAPQNRWVWRSQINQYQLTLENTVMGSDPERLLNAHDRQWRFAVKSDDAGISAVLPSVVLGYPQYELLFLAQGIAPYQLAWGRAATSVMQNQLASVLADIEDSDIAEVAVLEAMRGDAALPELAGEGAPWRKWLLFAILTLAVAAAGRMAYGLFREMNAG
jgi:hypothetical protein